MYSIVQQKFPDLDVSLLFPGYSQEIPTTIMETREEAEAILRERGMWPPKTRPRRKRKLPSRYSHFSINGKRSPISWATTWAATGVLGPSRTTSGGALLSTIRTSAIPIRVSGTRRTSHSTASTSTATHLPLIPIALLAHNRDIGWGLTMFANDDVDLYAEKVDPSNPNRVMYKGSWTDLQIEHETIKVRFAADVDYEVRVSPHGPIITPLLAKYEDYNGPPVSLYWVWQHVDYTDIAAFSKMARAHDYDSFAEGVALVTSPGVNVSYADREGNIAWWAAGKLPIRPRARKQQGITRWRLRQRRTDRVPRPSTKTRT